MARELLRIVIVGHVDHGKSTLIGRLFFDTGSLPGEKMQEIQEISQELGHDQVEFAFLMDHLQEERDQGITIDTAQAFFKSEKRDYVIIDAPGHRQFLKNMITGASQAEAALLVVDAEEGVREQTTRHAYLLSLLGLRQLIVAMNKMDKVNFSQERFLHVSAELEVFLKSIRSESVFLIPISSTLGDNIAKDSISMPWYVGPTILEALDQCQPTIPAERPLRLPVQDIYHLSSGKSVVVGKIEAGTLLPGQELLLLPKRTRIKVATLEKFLEQPLALHTGESGGLTLTTEIPISRGHVLADPTHPPGLYSTIPANVFWMARSPLFVGEKLTFRCATQETPCRVKTISTRLDSSTLEVIEEDAQILEETEVGKLLIETTHPMVVEEHSFLPELGRFVLERGSNVVAGGIVTGLDKA